MGQVFIGERRYDVTVRFPDSLRNSREAIGNLLLTSSTRPRTGEKEIGDVGGSQSAARAGRSARRSARRRGGAARSVGTRSVGRRVMLSSQRLCPRSWSRRVAFIGLSPEMLRFRRSLNSPVQNSLRVRPHRAFARSLPLSRTCTFWALGCRKSNAMVYAFPTRFLDKVEREVNHLAPR